jgi:hypothetical protein
MGKNWVISGLPTNQAEFQRPGTSRGWKLNWPEYRYLRTTFDLPIESNGNVVLAPSND